jgi:hypothetical protein
MPAATEGFPRELLTQEWTSRLGYFQAYTVAHPLLMEAKEKLLGVIQQPSRNSLVMVFGPTGVGKTTLRLKVEQVLTQDLLSELTVDCARIPVVSVDTIAPPSGNFNWRDHFKRVLCAMDEPLVDYKQRLPLSSAASGVRFTRCPSVHEEEYHHAVEQALRFRRPAAVLLDEAQHLAKMASGRRLQDQLDVIKSIANRTQTVHVLFGTYDLLAFRNLSGQLSRRSVDVHFRRYHADVKEERKMFQNVLCSFERHAPLPEPPNLVENWDYLYERSIGCVGILKEWLVKTLATVLRRGATKLTLGDLEGHAASVSQCEKMLAEAVEGEARLIEGAEARLRLRLALGLATGRIDSAKDVVPTHRSLRPGLRHPRRDPVGGLTPAHAMHATI